MEFKYFEGAQIATHISTGARIVVERMEPNDEIALRFDEGAEARVPNDEVKGLLDRLREEIEDVRLHNKFERLVNYDFVGDLSIVEAALAHHPTKNATKRTIQSWLSRRDRISSRKCPDWAVSYLEKYLKHHPDTKERCNRFQATQRESRSKRYSSFMENEGYSKTNEDAEYNISIEKQFRNRLSKGLAGTSLDVIAKELISMSLRLQDAETTNHCIITALLEVNADTTFKDFAANLLAHREILGVRNAKARKAQYDIENNDAEFASEDGTLPKEARE